MMKIKFFVPDYCLADSIVEVPLYCVLLRIMSNILHSIRDGLAPSRWEDIIAKSGYIELCPLEDPISTYHYGEIVWKDGIPHERGVPYEKRIESNIFYFRFRVGEYHVGVTRYEMKWLLDGE